jgi:hypothetical protein
MNRLALGFLALIVLCVFMWLVSAVRRRQRWGHFSGDGGSSH